MKIFRCRRSVTFWRTRSTNSKAASASTICAACRRRPTPRTSLRFIYWGLGKHLGTAVSQSRDGDLLGDVRDIGVDIYSPKGRGYRSKQKLSCHTDTCDVVGLMVLRTAMSGGLSVLASSVAIHNEIARTRPDLLEVLYQPFWWSWQGQEPPGDKPYYRRTGFHLSSRQVRLPLRALGDLFRTAVFRSAAHDDGAGRSDGAGR